MDIISENIEFKENDTVYKYGYSGVLSLSEK